DRIHSADRSHSSVVQAAEQLIDERSVASGYPHRSKDRSMPKPSRTNSRKLAFQLGLKKLKSARPRQQELKLTRRPRRICAITPSLYDGAGMPVENQIIQGDCIKTLNDGPEGWVDLVF